MNRILVPLFLVSVLSILQSCGPRAFTKGQYNDPNEVALLDDKFSENDMQLLSNALAEQLIQFEGFRDQKTRPLIMVGRVNNRSSEHIDIKMLTDRMRTAIIKTGKFRFSDKDAREDLKEEYSYQESEYVDQATAIKKGSQIGVQYLITGELGSNIQQVGNDKLIFYRLNMNLIDVKTNVIEWSGDREIRKKYRKRSVGF
jgi:hypothetical protein